MYTGTIFIYRLIFVRFYVPRELEVPNSRERGLFRLEMWRYDPSVLI